MKSIGFLSTLFVLTSSYLFSSGLEHKTHWSVAQVTYDKSDPETQFSGSTELKFKDKGYTLKLLVDYLYAPKYEKQYVQLNELYFSQDYKSYTFSLGKIIKHWGELEGYSITDTFNQKNYLLDPFDKDKKIGTWSVLASNYVDNNKFELGLKVSERNQKFPDIGTPFYPFPLSYSQNSKLDSSKLYPTFHASYGLSFDNDAQSEVKFIFQRGYDNKRYVGLSSNNALSQNIYKCNKYMFLFSSEIFDDTMFKIEAAYTHIDENTLVDDYTQVGVGLEKNIYKILGGDMMLVAEYYHYDSTKVANTDISEIYNNDVFGAIKYNFNDTRSSEIRAGLLYDVKTKEQVMQFKAKTRIFDTVLAAEVLAIKDAKESILSSFEDTLRANVSLTYYFK